MQVKLHRFSFCLKFLLVIMLLPLSSLAESSSATSEATSMKIERKEKEPPGVLGFGFHYHNTSSALGKEGTVWLSVHGVAPDSPAEKAGLQPQDLIIAIDDEPINFPDLRATLDFFSEVRPQQELKLTVKRGTQSLPIVMVAGIMTPEQSQRWRENYARLQGGCLQNDCGSADQNSNHKP